MGAEASTARASMSCEPLLARAHEAGDTWHMASANLDLVHSIYAAWERGDFSSVEWAHPEIEYVIVEGPAPGSWSGLAGLEEGGLGFLSAWEELRVEAEEYRKLDDERVL